MSAAKQINGKTNAQAMQMHLQMQSTRTCKTPYHHHHHYQYMMLTHHILNASARETIGLRITAINFGGPIRTASANRRRWQNSTAFANPAA